MLDSYRSIFNLQTPNAAASNTNTIQINFPQLSS